MEVRKLLLVVTIIITLLTGCSFKGDEYIAPQKYYAEITMTTYSNSEKQNIKYDMKILYNNNEYKIKINYNNINFFINCVDGKCTLVNEKFKDSQIVGSLAVFESLYNELNLDKFTGIKSRALNTVEKYDGLFKYVLEYEQKNLSPKKIQIYKDDALVKTFKYNKVELYK